MLLGCTKKKDIMKKGAFFWAESFFFFAIEINIGDPEKKFCQFFFHSKFILFGGQNMGKKPLIFKNNFNLMKKIGVLNVLFDFYDILYATSSFDCQLKIMIK